MDLKAHQAKLIAEIHQCESQAVTFKQQAKQLMERALFLKGAVALLNDQLQEVSVEEDKADKPADSNG